jgi:D-threo-aldose 1-dehydrogenase
LPVCSQRGVGIVAAGVFNSGLLARARPPDQARYNYVEASPALVDHARELASICDRHGTSLPAVALSFPFGHPSVVSVCVGARRPDQVAQNVALYRSRVPPEVWVDLKDSGLLRRDAPVP